MENCGAVGEKTLRQWICRTTGRKILSTVDIVGGEGEVRWLVGWREELESCAKSWIRDGKVDQPISQRANLYFALKIPCNAIVILLSGRRISHVHFRRKWGRAEMTPRF